MGSPMRVRYSARTDTGKRREINQDAYGSAEIGQGTLLVVCDGMGGHLAGEVASKLAVESIIAAFQPGEDPAEGLRQAFVVANQRVHAEGRGSMGTTAVAVFFWHNTLYVANVGDSRAYLVREGQIRQLTHDHSLIGDQVAAGLLTAEEARASNIRNIITRAIGHLSHVEVDLFREPLLPGDTIVLSTDGMHGLLTDEEIAAIASMHPLDVAARRLVDEANARGGPDNITVVIAQVDGLDPTISESVTVVAAPPPPPAVAAPPTVKPLSRVGLALATLVLVVLIGLGVFVTATDQRTPPPLLSSPTIAATATPISTVTPLPTATP
ncbi:PP2C family serine/threonine-protein phosphatase [Chloroflexus sp.]|uniref:PP2C family protein-serine/threonine phosphatase n=1 Tax=Chloroflexus sp. TaxID=1904827 RepID=UPI00298F367D|nr:PP2C family serine/threonine-protein phosphatase [Chloroflexus sp.]MDW8405701.1 protein phosphatase 2C domain-containing protein [Chloroflexus sp.]